LRVAYRASPEGPRDIVYLANWFTCCEVLPELPGIEPATEIALSCENTESGDAKRRESTRNDLPIRKRC
jgi:hypothetical protein